jgi:hypothetical protein
MSIAFRIFSKSWIAGLAVYGLGSVVACVGDDGAPAATGGTGGGLGGSSATGGSAAGSGGRSGGAGPAGSHCASPIALPSAKAGIANFDEYDGSADLHKWSFALGSDPATGVFSGTFVYGDEPNGYPETFEMAAGKDSKYAFSIADTLAEEYGGGMGLWLSTCLDTSGFSGISFWARGDSPSQNAKFTILMQETTSATPKMAGDKFGTCMGTDTTCIHPSYTFPVTDTWTEVKVPWSAFMPGNANGTAVVPNGKNIWQIQFDVGLMWGTDASGAAAPIPAPYEFAVDSLTFY